VDHYQVETAPQDIGWDGAGSGEAYNVTDEIEEEYENPGAVHNAGEAFGYSEEDEDEDEEGDDEEEEDEEY
jgi:hypothetical protein